MTLQAAFQSCIGEGIEYLSQLQAGGDPLRRSDIERDDGNRHPNTLELIAALAARRIQPERAMSWLAATRVLDGSSVWLPADICVRRPLNERDFVPPYRLSVGSAAGISRDAAALHGLLELIERDATSLWWRGGLPPRSISPHHAASVAAEKLLKPLRHGVARPRRTWLLDITTDIGVPCVVAASCRPDGAGFAFGLAARPLLEAAACSAIVEMCQLELADAVVAAKRNERGDDALNAQDRIHLQRAGIHVDRCKLLHPIDGQADYLSINATEESVAFRLIVERLEQIGVETFCIDLTRQHFAVPVMRVITPGLQHEPSEIVTARLQNAIGRTGGGASYTGGIALI
ncbi:MAG: YcaO-like family protein [Bradyrhizobium sp.]